MHIVELRLLNWCRFRGEHQLQLEPTIYGVTARKDDNPDASNWSGKTCLLDAIRFVLFGVHSKPTEDGWITHGEQEGGVGALLSDGTVIERRRGRSASSEQWWCEVEARGKDAATRLVVRSTKDTACSNSQGQLDALQVETSGGMLLFDASAQAHIDAVVGLDKDDFEATCWVQQKQADKFVKAKPAERMAIVAGWLRLDPLKRAEVATGKRINALFADEARTVATRTAAVDRIVRVLADYFEDVTGEEPANEVLPELEDIAVVCESDEAQAIATSKAQRAAVMTSLDEQVRAQEKWDVASGQALRAGEVNVKFAELLKMDLPTEMVRLERAMDEAQADLSVKGEQAALLGSAHKDVNRLACGKFDGRCPLDGHTCPDMNVMNEASARNAKRAAAALKAYDDAERARNLAKRMFEDARAAVAKVREQIARRDHLADELRRLAPFVEYIKTHPIKPTTDTAQMDKADALEVAVADAHSKVARVRLHIREATEALGVRDANTTMLEQVRKRIKIQQAVLLIVGKQGAQRRVAEGAVLHITELANGALSGAGVNLSTEVRWARETKELADTCGKCGAPFPRSRSAKRCTRCEAERGPKLSEKIEVVLSDDSGAAEDIAGVALQLAAATWLRSVRDSQWACVVLDEPLAAADKHNRKAMAQHFVALLRGSYGFAQAMVTAHSMDAVDTMPGRIEVVAHEDGSTVSVLQGLLDAL